MNKAIAKSPMVSLAAIFLGEVVLLSFPLFFPDKPGPAPALQDLFAPLVVIVYISTPIAAAVFAGQILAAQGSASKGFSYFPGAMFSIIGMVAAAGILLNLKGS